VSLGAQAAPHAAQRTGVVSSSTKEIRPVCGSTSSSFTKPHSTMSAPKSGSMMRRSSAYTAASAAALSGGGAAAQRGGRGRVRPPARGGRAEPKLHLSAGAAK